MAFTRAVRRCFLVGFFAVRGAVLLSALPGLSAASSGATKTKPNAFLLCPPSSLPPRQSERTAPAAAAFAADFGCRHGRSRRVLSTATVRREDHELPQSLLEASALRDAAAESDDGYFPELLRRLIADGASSEAARRPSPPKKEPFKKPARRFYLEPVLPSSVCVGCGVRLQVRKAERLFSAQKRCTLQRAGSTAIDLRSDSLQTRNACGVGFIPASKMNPPQRGAPAEKASSAASSLLSQAKRLLQEVASEKSEGEKDQDWLAFQKASAAAVEGADEEEKEAEPPPPVCQRCFSLHVGKRISEDLVSDALGSQPVLIAVNKVDLLPRKQVGVQRAPSVRVRAAVLDTLKRLEEKRGKRLNLADGKIHLVSCRSGEGVFELIDAARKAAKGWAPSVVVAGSTNAGKSSFCKALLRPGSYRQTNSVCTSALPGTTLDFVPFKLLENKSSDDEETSQSSARAPQLLDAPGLVDEGSFAALLNAIAGRGWREAAADVVLGGLGWVAFTAPGEIRIAVHCPQKVALDLRPPLFPEAIPLATPVKKSHWEAANCALRRKHKARGRGVPADEEGVAR